MDRICPNCNKCLKESESFFCANCGTELPDDILNPVAKYNFKITKFDSSGVKFNSKPVMILIAVLAILGGSFLIVRYIPKTLTTKQTATVSQTQSPASIKSSINTGAEKFENPRLITFVPVEVDFYLESSDFPSFYNAFTSSLKTRSFLEVFLDDIENVFILAGRQVDGKWEIGLFFKVKNQDNILDLLDDVHNENWRVVLIKDVLLTSNSEKFIEDSVASSSGVAKNITQNAGYAARKLQLPDKGQLIFINMRGDASQAYDLLEYYQADKQLISITDSARELKYDKFVLTND